MRGGGRHVWEGNGERRGEDTYGRVTVRGGGRHVWEGNGERRGKKGVNE